MPRVLEGDISPRALLNINAPGLAPEAVRGARITRLGRRIYNDELVLEATEGARRRFTIYGKSASYQREDGTDFAAIEGGQISVTPMHFDLTDIDEMDNLERMWVVGPARPRARSVRGA